MSRNVSRFTALGRPLYSVTDALPYNMHTNKGVEVEVKRPFENFLFMDKKCQYLIPAVLLFDFT